MEYNESNKPISTFRVKSISYDKEERISALVIEDGKGNTVYSYPRFKSANTEQKTGAKPKDDDFSETCQCEKCGKTLQDYLFGGKTVTVSNHIALSKMKYDGHIYCIECINKLKAQAS